MRVAVLSTLASACGPSLASDGDSRASSSTTALESETGDDACPELIWSDLDADIHAELEITSMEQAVALPLYTRIDGTLRILAVPGITDLTFLSCLSEVRGGLAIANNPDLQTLDGLQRLSAIKSPFIEYATLAIEGNPNLRNLEGLSGLETLPRLSIADNPRLESVDGLANLVTADLDGLASLQSYDDLSLKGNASLASIDGLLGATGDFNRVELNEALPYAAVVQLSGSLASCGNLDEPEPCECQLSPPD